MTKRENGLDLLRIFAAYLVVTLHVCTFIRQYVADIGELNFSYHYFMFIRQMTTSAVIVFIMLSGAFVLKASSTKDFASFYKKTWKKLCIPTVILSFFYWFFNAFIYWKTGIYGMVFGIEDLTYPQALMFQGISFLKGTPSEHMWYMYTLIGLYLMAPFVALGKEKLGESRFKKIAIIVCLWGIIDALVNPSSLFWGIGYCAQLLGVFMMGYVAHEWALLRKGKNGLGCALIVLATAITAVEYFIFLSIRDNGTLSAYVTPMVPYNLILVIATLFYVAGFTIIDIKKDFGYLSLLTFWVYLLHPAIMMVLFLIEEAVFKVPFLEIGRESPILIGTGNSILVYVLSFVCGHVIEKCSSRKK